MRIFTLYFIIVFVVIVGFCILFSLNPFWQGNRQGELTTTMQKALNEYEQYISESLCQSGTPGAAVTIVKGRDVLYLQGFGVRNQRTRELVNVHTVFRLASVSKPFTSMLTGVLVEDSLLSWDDPIVRHWPAFSLNPPGQTHRLTVSHVLSHTTGFPYHAYTNLIEEGKSFSALMSALKNLSLVHPVGKHYNYQNVAFSIIEEVIERATGKPFTQNMKERLFQPLDMQDASMSYEELYTNPNAAYPHSYQYEKTWQRIPLSPTYYNVAPAGGINASISDMSKWLRAALGHSKNVISPLTINQLFEPVISADPKNKNFNLWQSIQDSYYGRGWRILCFANDTIAYHGGYVKGYRSEVVIHPKEKIGICVLTNGAGNFPNQAIPTFFRIYDRYHRDPVKDRSMLVYKKRYSSNPTDRLSQ